MSCSCQCVHLNIYGCVFLRVCVVCNMIRGFSELFRRLFFFLLACFVLGFLFLLLLVFYIVVVVVILWKMFGLFLLNKWKCFCIYCFKMNCFCKKFLLAFLFPFFSSFTFLPSFISLIFPNFLVSFLLSFCFPHPIFFYLRIFLFYLSIQFFSVTFYLS